MIMYKCATAALSDYRVMVCGDDVTVLNVCEVTQRDDDTQ